MAPGWGLAARGRQLEIQAANFEHGSNYRPKLIYGGHGVFRLMHGPMGVTF